MPADVTIYAVADLAGVGIATVSRVINGSPQVSPQTRGRVRQAIADLGYRPNRAACHLAGGRTRQARIAVLLPFFSAHFYFSVTKALAHELAGSPADLALYDIRDRSDKNRVLDRLLAERACDGLVLVGCSIGDQRCDQLERLGLPAVLIDRRHPRLPWVTIDNARGGRLMAEHLRTCGARRPGIIAGPDRAVALADRAAALDATLGGAPRETAAALESAAGAVATRELLERHPDLDALACVNDALAVGALEALRSIGRRVPDEVQVIGFDDQPFMDFIGLTTIRQPMATFGHWAGRSILTMITRPGQRPDDRLLPIHLVPRHTTRTPQEHSP